MLCQLGDGRCPTGLGSCRAAPIRCATDVLSGTDRRGFAAAGYHDPEKASNRMWDRFTFPKFECSSIWWQSQHNVFRFDNSFDPPFDIGMM